MKLVRIAGRLCTARPLLRAGGALATRQRARVALYWRKRRPAAMRAASAASAAAASVTRSAGDNARPSRTCFTSVSAAIFTKVAATEFATGSGLRSATVRAAAGMGASVGKPRLPGTPRASETRVAPMLTPRGVRQTRAAVAASAPVQHARTQTAEASKIADALRIFASTAVAAAVLPVGAPNVPARGAPSRLQRAVQTPQPGAQMAWRTLRLILNRPGAEARAAPNAGTYPEPMRAAVGNLSASSAPPGPVAMHLAPMAQPVPRALRGSRATGNPVTQPGARADAAPLTLAWRQKRRDDGCRAPSDAPEDGTASGSPARPGAAQALEPILAQARAAARTEMHSAINLERLADELMRRVDKRLRIERERRGR